LTQQVNSFHPDVVVAAGGMWDVSDRELAGSHSWVHIGDGRYDTYLANEVRHVADLVQSTGAQLVWLSSPDWNPVYTPADFMAPGPYAVADQQRSADFNQLLSIVLNGRPRTQILDLNAWMKAQPGGEFAPTLRADGVHFTMTSTDTAAAWLVPQLVTIGRSSESTTSTTTAPPAPG
jgi:hypothetical protein